MAEVNDNGSIQLFEDQKIRTAWDAEKEEWYFSIIDVISVLTGTANPRRYWSDLKRKLKAEGANELYEKIVQLKMLSSDGKRYKTDVANTEQLLRIIQSIPSPKAEPFKAWLAMVGNYISNTAAHRGAIQASCYPMTLKTNCTTMVFEKFCITTRTKEKHLET